MTLSPLEHRIVFHEMEIKRLELEISQLLIKIDDHKDKIKNIKGKMIKQRMKS